jgi:hypothetical protein
MEDKNRELDTLLTLTRDRSPSPAATQIFLSTNVETGIQRKRITFE